MNGLSEVKAMINFDAVDKIRKPNEWNTYEQPIDNLIHAIIIQAVADCRGYSTDDKIYHDGREACDFLETTGVKLFEYLITRSRKNISDEQNRHRRYKAIKRNSGTNYRRVI